MAGDEVIINYTGSNYVMIEGQCYEFIEFKPISKGRLYI